MNHLIFTAVLTACLGIGGYQQSSEFFGPSTEGLGYDPYHNPGQLNLSNTGPWPPLVSLHSTLSIAIYTSAYYILTYFAGSFGRFNIHAKVFLWLMMVYPIITALTGFQFSNLLPYILQVVPTILGYYSYLLLGKAKDWQENLACLFISLGFSLVLVTLGSDNPRLGVVGFAIFFIIMAIRAQKFVVCAVIVVGQKVAGTSLGVRVLMSSPFPCLYLV
ncbi:hypothetical protein DSO57_1019343 [Entomophthora muscae]|uniref:Uncharacterized protein n=1 Tax=Entomophthora muscae TaxID=34485 RepID=A0ACC2SGY8_9FUNG|nr:hypothetical protein DSO57_1019343 [Entomophthora muscae]